MTARPPPPASMDDEASYVEPRPSATTPQTRRTIGRIESESSVTLASPAPQAKGRRGASRAGVGLRAAMPAGATTSKAIGARNQTRQKIREARDEHRQRVWDKLDVARKRADEKRPRIQTFAPPRGRDDP